MMILRTEEGAWKWAFRDFLREAAIPAEKKQKINQHCQHPSTPKKHFCSVPSRNFPSPHRTVLPFPHHHPPTAISTTPETEK